MVAILHRGPGPGYGCGGRAAATSDSAARADSLARGAVVGTDSAHVRSAETGETVGPDDFGSPLVLVILLGFTGLIFLIGAGMLALLALAVGIAILLTTGVVSASVVWRARRSTTWAERADLFLRVAGTVGGLLSGAAFGAAAHWLKPEWVGLGWGILSGAVAGLLAGWVLARLAQWLLRRGWQWFEVKFA